MYFNETYLSFTLIFRLDIENCCLRTWARKKFNIVTIIRSWKNIEPLFRSFSFRCYGMAKRYLVGLYCTIHILEVDCGIIYQPTANYSVRQSINLYNWLIASCNTPSFLHTKLDCLFYLECISKFWNRFTYTEDAFCYFLKFNFQRKPMYSKKSITRKSKIR